MTLLSSMATEAGGRNHRIRPDVSVVHTGSEILGVGPESRETDTATPRVNAEGGETNLERKRRKARAASRAFAKADWVTHDGRVEFEKLMEDRGVELGSEEWLDYARRFVTAVREAEGQSTTGGTSSSGAADTSGSSNDGAGGGLSAGMGVDSPSVQRRDNVEAESGAEEVKRGKSSIHGRPGNGQGVVEPDEGRELRTRTPPDCPSEKAWRIHRLTHYPYRQWCPCCRRARGIALPHRRGRD